MKNIYVLFASLLSTVAFAQLTTSFETSEGYQLGNINNQNNWEVTEGSDGFLTNQVITDEKASNGSFSFKNAFESDYNDQWFPIFGAVKSFAEPISYQNFTLTYDVLVTEKNGSDFELTLFAINEDEDYVPVAGVGIENRGYIYLFKDEFYDFDYAEAEWEENQWINVKIEVTASEIKYYINDELQNTIANFTQLEIAGINMLHNNYGGDGYYDNVVITTGNLGSASYRTDAVAIYPNPAKNNITIAAPAGVEITQVDIYYITGQKVMTVNNNLNIDIATLAEGAYILQAKTTTGTTLTQKVIKN